MTSMREARMTEVQNATSSTVVVGVDGSASSLEALEWAAAYAAAFSFKVRAVSAYHYPVDYGYAYALPADIDFAADARKQLLENVGQVQSKFPAVEFESEIVNSAPAAALIEDSQKAALLVVGSRGHGGFAGMLLGSVSNSCVAHAHCPVVVMR
jgi:nucleotide-binding universal stress UspA family protein